MFVFRHISNFAMGVVALGVGCASTQAERGQVTESRPTKTQAVTNTGEKPEVAEVKPKTVPAAKPKADPLAEYLPREKTWCDERPIVIEEESYADGTKKSRYEVVMSEDGEFVRHGKSETWWETGRTKLEVYYVCGVKHGPKRTWWADGTAWSVGGFYEGKDHGTWIVWDNSGVKTKQYQIEKGVWQGMFTVWHPNGQKRLEVEFVDGLRQGNMTFWDDHGNVLKTIEFLDGKEQPMPGA